MALGAGACGDPPTNGSDGGTGGGGGGGTGGGGGGGTGGGGGPDGGIGCGDGIRSSAEACDDGNITPGDGCSADCREVELGWQCPLGGGVCVPTVCGNSQIEQGETCDDGNASAGDGCDATCRLEPGYVCPTVGVRCVATECGDGVLAGNEQCDDGDAASGDGCSSTCSLEWGFECPTVGADCLTLTCGHAGPPRGLEQCNDHNDVPYDGCHQCLIEPDCTNGVCEASCGDGLVTHPEACDDGNLSDGDGCDSACEIEAGFACEIEELPPPTTITLPSILRDFRGRDVTGGHPDFQPVDATSLRGFVQTNLDAQGRPQRVATNPDPGNDSFPTSAASFTQWYTNDSSVNRTVYDSITLTRNAAGVYQFPATGTSGPNYFPLDGRGFNAPGSVPFENTRSGSGGQHNFLFTTEIRYTFEYEGNEVLRFVGDDDLFVFVNGRLCLDLGGQHGAETGVMNFASPSAGLVTECRNYLNGIRDAFQALPGNADRNPTFEMAIFGAERHTTESNFFLTLGNFVKRQSVCTAVCGDGIVTPLEQCDLGAANATPAPYGGCTAGAIGAGGCMFGPYCGDNVVDEEEACDDGTNLGGYGQCSPTCSTSIGCGNGFLEADEACDDGNRTSGDGCSDTCLVEIVGG